MKNAINWKSYLIIGTIVSVFCFFFDYKIALGFIFGTLIYFINLFLSDKKFPNFSDKAKTISKAIGIMLVEGLLTIVMAIATYKLGGLKMFFAGFAGMIIPNIYFFIVGSFKK